MAEYAVAAKKDKKGIFHNTVIKSIAIIIGVIVIAVAGFAIIDTILYANKVHAGVTVGGMAAGGKDEATLRHDLDVLNLKIANQKATIRYGGKTWTANAKDLDVRIDIDKTVDKAFSVGRNRTLTKNAQKRATLWFTPTNIEPIYAYNKEQFDRFEDIIAKSVDVAAQDAAIKISENGAVVTGSKDGKHVNKPVLTAELLHAFSTNQKNSIEVPVKTTKPDIAGNDLSEAKKIVDQMIKVPLSLKYQDKQWQIPTDMITNWIAFDKVRQGDHWTVDVSLNKDDVVSYIKELTEGLTTEPKDAMFNIAGKTVVIAPSSQGTQIDVDKAFDAITEISKTTDDPKEVMLSTQTAEPKLTTQDAQNMGIKEQVSSFTTFFNAGQASRVHNIQTLGRALDGTILAPGETFSFNGKIGPRTAEKGYQEAPAIVNGELVPTLGGGVCQVATTLFNTIFFGGYEVVERHNHSFFISHYPTGRDATVSFGGPDLKFKNNFEQYTLIKTSTTTGSITISFYSTNQNIKVDYTTSGPSNFKPAPEKRQDDPSLAKGTRKVFDKGISGRDVTVNRTVTKDGAEFLKDKFFSRYDPKPTVVKVGTEVVAAPVTPPATPPTTNPTPVIPPAAPGSTPQ
ncbi:MAG TPA: VanW family protein [Candidatus Aquicultor sp.]|jgi:vancomycin resistance protein YoaR